MPQASNAARSGREASRAEYEELEDTAGMVTRLLGATSEISSVLPPLVSKLQAREARLDARERDLNKRERELQKRERDLERQREQNRDKLMELQRGFTEQGAALQEARKVAKEAQAARATQEALVQKETGTTPTPESSRASLQALARATAAMLIRADQ